MNSDGIAATIARRATGMTHTTGIGVIRSFLCFFLVMGIWFIIRNSATFDEPMHYYAGHVDLGRGDFAVSYQLPPLSKKIAVLPVYLLSHLHLIAAPHFTTAAENPTAGLDLLYRSPLSASVQLSLGRLPVLLLGLLTIVVIARWAYRLWGMVLSLLVYAAVSAGQVWRRGVRSSVRIDQPEPVR